MNTELYIAKRLLKGGSQKKSTGLMVSISIFGIALSVAVMMIAVAITTGFKEEIGRKATGFAADIQITNLDSNRSLYNMSPISASQPFLDALNANPEVRHVQQFCIKPGIMKSADEIQGIVLKGVGGDFDWDFFRNNMIEGDVFETPDSAISNKIVLSKHIAKLLQLKLGDRVVVYFVQVPLRAFPFIISGIYDTGLVELDKKFALVDMRRLQRLNDWTPDQISGFEIFIRNFDNIERVTNEVFDLAGFRLSENGSALNVQNVRELYSQLFDWLSLQDTTVAIILLLMVLVAGFNMISGLLIIILERTSTIGILKALGANSRLIRKIFLYESAFFVGKGLLWGNAIALILCWVQWKFGVITLDQESYFLDRAPISIHLLQLILINIGAASAILLMLILPSAIISKISPESTMKYR
ncbi:MAG: ABC transporter permease [Bacteroidales bacterium]|nr:ABC transporter permease [Bacteroidales bacterium]